MTLQEMMPQYLESVERLHLFAQTYPDLPQPASVAVLRSKPTITFFDSDKRAVIEAIGTNWTPLLGVSIEFLKPKS